MTYIVRGTRKSKERSGKKRGIEKMKLKDKAGRNMLQICNGTMQWFQAVPLPKISTSNLNL